MSKILSSDIMRRALEHHGEYWRKRRPDLIDAVWASHEALRDRVSVLDAYQESAGAEQARRAHENAEAIRLTAELTAAREALGEAWLAGGVSLAEGIRRKTARLEEIARLREVLKTTASNIRTIRDAQPGLRTLDKWLEAVEDVLGPRAYEPGDELPRHRCGMPEVVFESFNPIGPPCPVCQTHAPAPTVLVPIPGTTRGGCCEGRQYHKACRDLVERMADKEAHRASKP